MTRKKKSPQMFRMALFVLLFGAIFLTLYYGRGFYLPLVTPNPHEYPENFLGSNNILTATSTDTSLLTTDGKPYQYAVFAFDGSRSLDEWRETLDFAHDMSASGTPVHFTYFINAIYLLPKDHKDLYHPPHNPIGTSLIGYGSSTEEIGKRVALINEAYRSGHEIGSHGVGHIPGVGWTKDDWISELTQFAALLARTRHGIDTTVPLEVPLKAIKGFRAPDLAQNQGLQDALDVLGYDYDTSQVSRMGVWPKKIGNHWELPLASIPFRGKTILSMDYNFFIADSHAHDTLRRGTREWQKDHDEMLAAYLNYFNKNYLHNRAPVFIGHHFSEWNDGLYWEVMKEAAREICHKPDVRCATHQETLSYLSGLSLNSTSSMEVFAGR